MFLLKVFIFAVCSSTVLTSFVDDVKEIEEEVAQVEEVLDPLEVEKIKTHLNSYYSSSCPPSQNVAYDDYFTPDARFNTAGRKGFDKFEQFDLGEEKQSSPGCSMIDVKVRDVEVYSNTAIAMVTGRLQLGDREPTDFVKVHELVRSETEAWRTEVSLMFLHVNISNEISHIHPKEEQEIKDQLLKLYDEEACEPNHAQNLAPYVADDAIENLGGRRLLNGLEGIEVAVEKTNAGGCMIEERRIVDVEVDNGTAIAIAAGHSQQSEHPHPFLQVFEMNKQPDGIWMFDVIILFLTLEPPPQ